MAMENVPFIDDFPIKTTIDRGFSMAMLNNQMVMCLLPAADRKQKHQELNSEADGSQGERGEFDDFPGEPKF